MSLIYVGEIHRSLLVFGVYLRISNSSKYSPMAWVISIKKLLLYVATEGALHVTAKMMYDNFMSLNNF